MTSCVAVSQIAAERRFDFLRERGDGLFSRIAATIGLRRRPEAAVEPEWPARRHEKLPALIGDLCHDVADAGRRPVVVCRNVQNGYGDRQVLQSIDMTVSRSEVVVIMGPSGSGKSTLLSMINYLELLDWGEITVDDRHVGYQRMPGGGLRPAGNLARARSEACIGMGFSISICSSN
jgi:ABC-type multidrug transport system fused ATPase/permease subunit